MLFAHPYAHFVDSPVAPCEIRNRGQLISCHQRLYIQAIEFSRSDCRLRRNAPLGQLFTVIHTLEAIDLRALRQGNASVIGLHIGNWNKCGAASVQTAAPHNLRPAISFQCADIHSLLKRGFLLRSAAALLPEYIPEHI